MTDNRKAFEEVWDKGDYRRGSTAHRLVPLLAGIIPVGSTINDYGSGTGRAEVILTGMGYDRINMVDIAGNALEPEAMALVERGRVTLTICPLERLPADFPVADWGICINVLMLVDPASLDKILSEMRRTCRNIIVEVYDMDDVRLGRNWTTIKGDAAWWKAEVSKYWREAESVKSPEHKRRYITIGRS